MNYTHYIAYRRRVRMFKQAFALFTFGLASAFLMMITACQTVYLKDKTSNADGTSHTVTAYEGSLLSNNKLQDLDVNYNGVLIKVKAWDTKGDSVFISAVGSAIVNGIMAYSTMGGSEAVKAAVGASLAPAVQEPVESVSVEDKKPGDNPPGVTSVSLPPPGASGRLILIGNSKTCGYCKQFQPLIDSKEFKDATAGFAFSYADVKGDKANYDALFAKYGKGVTVYPTLVVVDAAGKITGHIEGRSDTVQPFTVSRLIEMIESLCPDCKPK